jgi:uncharacterized iron-regulated protein
MKTRPVLFAVAVFIIAGVTVAQAQAPAHPLLGKILDTRTGAITELTDPALVPKLFPCGAITLLGEVHDNPDHHTMRAALIKAKQLTETCRLGVAIFEHISADQTDRSELNFAPARGQLIPTASELFKRLDWDQTGWPSAHLFEPLFAQVLTDIGVIVAGNPSRAMVRRVAREGAMALDETTAQRLGVTAPLDAMLNDALLSELEASHCGLMPKTAFTNMAVAQRFKDAHMADMALRSMQPNGASLILAGNGHVRTDRGVPSYIRKRAPDSIVVAITFAEVEDGKVDPAAYGPRDPAGKPATDYIAFAAPVPREDPCEAMRRRMKK